MRIAVHPADEGACGHYRMIWPAQAAGHEPDVDVEVDTTRPHDSYTVLWSTGPDGTQHVHGVTGDLPDVVVLQRPLWRGHLELIDLFQARGTAVVVEVDDDFASVPKANAAWGDTQPQWFSDVQAATLAARHPDVMATATWTHSHQPGRTWRRIDGHLAPVGKAWLAKACRRADLVVVSTGPLAERYGAHGRVEVLRNHVPARYFDVGHDRDPDRPVLGWGGSLATHHGDLDPLGPAVAEALDLVPAAVFRQVGDGRPAAATLEVDEARAERTGWVPLTDGWPEAIAAFDVGIAPLADTRFNRAKSWLKPLEYSALGVAWVASSLPEYQLLADRGAGQLAASPAGWREHLARLLEDDGERADQAEANRAAVADLTYEAQGWRWAEAWQRALDHRRAQRRRVAVA